ncbi:MAG: helix-turn-helix transcriptional regulator [Synergistaceae bacterium]|jgi:DNA-binding CsgD family transcriptional regulator|nr:helix-turn-helix transcriptional regulator [Synergistaceae bacterium]
MNVSFPDKGFRASLWSRLFIFFLLLVMTMTAAVTCVLLLSGYFSVETAANRRALDAEIYQLSHALERQFGEISAHALQLSRQLSRSIEDHLAKAGAAPEDLSTRPDLVESVIDDLYDPLFYSCGVARASGVFLILNSTAGNHGRDVLYSRAGFYIKNWEPNIVSDASPAILCLRGSTRIAYRRRLVLDPQWTMEFDVEGENYYYLPQRAATDRSGAARNLYYWQPAGAIKGSSYRAMLCSAPLTDSQGKVFGVCGFEVSDILFRMSYVPAGGAYKSAFCVLAPAEAGVLDMSQALISWRYNEVGEPRLGKGPLVSGGDGYTEYRLGRDEAFAGMHRKVRIYSADSPFAGKNFALAILTPRADVDAAVSSRNLKIALCAASLLAVGVAASYFFSKWYLDPLLKGLDAIRTGMEAGTMEGSGGPESGTRIQEIDDLIEFLKSVSGTEKVVNRLSEKVMEEFAEKVKLLTPAEKKVFDLCVKGHSAEDIARLLHLSVNTVKSHNTRIFAKMNISSRTELLSAYVKNLRGEK